MAFPLDHPCMPGVSLTPRLQQKSCSLLFLTFFTRSFLSPSPLSLYSERLFHSFTCFFFPFLLYRTQRLTAGLRRIAVPTSSLHYIDRSTNSPSQRCLTHILDNPGVSGYIPVPSNYAARIHIHGLPAFCRQTDLLQLTPTESPL